MAKHLESNTCCRRNPLRIVLPASSLARHVQPQSSGFSAHMLQWSSNLQLRSGYKPYVIPLSLNHMLPTFTSLKPFFLVTHHLTTSTSPPPPHHLRHISQISQIILSVTTASLLRQLLSCDSFSPVTTSPPRQLLHHNSFILTTPAQQLYLLQQFRYNSSIMTALL